MITFNQHSYDRDHELALIENFMREGVNDPGIFKAFFTAGGPGSGKSYVAGRVGAGKMSPYGLMLNLSTVKCFMIAVVKSRSKLIG